MKKKCTHCGGKLALSTDYMLQENMKVLYLYCINCGRREFISEPEEVFNLRKPKRYIRYFEENNKRR